MLPILLATLIFTTPVALPEVPVPMIDQPAAVEYVQMPLYSSSSVKRYEDYRAITNTSSLGYQLTRQAYICSDGTLEIDGYKLVAVGKGYGTVGEKLRVTFTDGRQLNLLIADNKQDAHTLNGAGYSGTDGHVIECIVDTRTMPATAKRMGDCNYIDIFNGELLMIEKEI